MIFIKDVHLAFGHKKIFTGIAGNDWAERQDFIGWIEWFRKTFPRDNGWGSSDEGEVEKPDYATVGYLPQDGVTAKMVLYEKKWPRLFRGWRNWRRSQWSRKNLVKWTPKRKNFMIWLTWWGMKSNSPVLNCKKRIRELKEHDRIVFLEDIDRRDEFSGGCRCVLLWAVTLQGPSLLILDEPTKFGCRFAKLAGALLRK